MAATRLLAQSEDVREVSPSLTHVVRRRRGKGKSDPIDAVAVARVVAADETLPSARRTVLLADLKVLVVTNDAEPVVGAITTYRWFHVSGEQLRSIGLGDYLWVPGRNAARCHLAGQAGTKTVWVNDPEDPDGIVKTKEQRVWAHGRIPSIECTCGFYVLRDEPVLESGDAVPHRSVVCRVAIWGRAIQYTEGYRAEFAAITGLITATPRRYKAVLNAYEIPAVQARTKAEQGLTDGVPGSRERRSRAPRRHRP